MLLLCNIPLFLEEVIDLVTINNEGLLVSKMSVEMLLPAFKGQVHNLV